MPGSARANASRVIFADHTLMPGTVNAHNHSFQSLLRGIGDDLPFLEWRDRALYRYSPRLGADDMATAALFAFGEMLLHGVTTVCDFYYLNAQGNEHASATIEAARRLGIRIVLARCFYDWDGAPAAYRETIPQAVAQLRGAARAATTIARAHLVSVQPAPHSQHGATPRDDRGGRRLRAATPACRGTSTSPRSATRSTQSLERFGARPLHAVAGARRRSRARDRRARLLVRRGRARAPGRARRRRSPTAPARTCSSATASPTSSTCRARGVRIGLGTDGGCSNNRVSVLDEMRTCALLQKVARDRRPGDRRRGVLRDGHRAAAATCSACRSGGSRSATAATWSRSISTIRRSGRSRP